MFLLSFLQLFFLLRAVVGQDCPPSTENAQDSQGLDLQSKWPSTADGTSALVECPQGYWTNNRDDGLYGITRSCASGVFAAPVGTCSMCPTGCKICTSDNWKDCTECADGWGTRSWSNDTDVCYELNCQTDFFDAAADDTDPCLETNIAFENPAALTCEAGDAHVCEISDCCRKSTFSDRLTGLRTESFFGIGMACLLLFMGTWSFFRQHGVFRLFACSCCPRTIRSLMEAPPRKPESLKNAQHDR